MARNRVLSFVSQLSSTFNKDTRPPSPISPTSSVSPSPIQQVPEIPTKPADSVEPFPDLALADTPPSPPSSPDAVVVAEHGNSKPVDTENRRLSTSSTTPRPRRPSSIVGGYQPPVMEITEDTIPELQPVYNFLNNQATKLYQEGYFLKLDDQNIQGQPNADRTWHECYAQLVGTVLSLWDAAELDAAGDDGEVLPKFINVTDASIKMIESLEMASGSSASTDSQGLKNILSICTAGRNRYLLHFNSRHSLLQWTASIRLAIHEHSTLQEAYTGALIAGKAKLLNNIQVIMERATAPIEQWVRVRFGAGVPWRRCWCVITPPGVKEIQKAQKEHKKRSPYDRSGVPILKGDIKFFDTRVEGKKAKKMRPIATLSEAFAAYAIYPQAKSLIDASTLLKIEGTITAHSEPAASTEGFVFLMPESHPAISGFEMLLRFLFPTWDTFALYGRPGKLVASVLDSRSLMYAMPKHKKYGYLDVLDVSNLVQADDKQSWSEKEWRKQLKEVTGKRMNSMDEAADARSSRSHSRSGSRNSIVMGGYVGGIGGGGSSPPRAPRVGFAGAGDNTAVRNSRSFSLSGPGSRPEQPGGGVGGGAMSMADRGPVQGLKSRHVRNSSDPEVSFLAHSTRPFVESPHSAGHSRTGTPVAAPTSNLRNRADTIDQSSDDDQSTPPPPPAKPIEDLRRLHTPDPVARPPAFSHNSQTRPISKAYHSPDLRHANSRLSSTTLSELAKAGRAAIDMEANDSYSAQSGVSSTPLHNQSQYSQQSSSPPPPPPPFGNPAANYSSRSLHDQPSSFFQGQGSAQVPVVQSPSSQAASLHGSFGDFPPTPMSSQFHPTRSSSMNTSTPLASSRPRSPSVQSSGSQEMGGSVLEQVLPKNASAYYPPGQGYRHESMTSAVSSRYDDSSSVIAGYDHPPQKPPDGFGNPADRSRGPPAPPLPINNNFGGQTNFGPQGPNPMNNQASPMPFRGRGGPGGPGGPGGQPQSRGPSSGPLRNQGGRGGPDSSLMMQQQQQQQQQQHPPPNRMGPPDQRPYSPSFRSPMGPPSQQGPGWNSNSPRLGGPGSQGGGNHSPQVGGSPRRFDHQGPPPPSGRPQMPPPPGMQGAPRTMSPSPMLADFPPSSSSAGPMQRSGSFDTLNGPNGPRQNNRDMDMRNRGQGPLNAGRGGMGRPDGPYQQQQQQQQQFHNNPLNLRQLPVMSQPSTPTYSHSPDAGFAGRGGAPMSAGFNNGGGFPPQYRGGPLPPGGGNGPPPQGQYSASNPNTPRMPPHQGQAF